MLKLITTILILAGTILPTQAQQSSTKGLDIHDCAEGADEDVGKPPYTPKPATSWAAASVSKVRTASLNSAGA